MQGGWFSYSLVVTAEKSMGRLNVRAWEHMVVEGNGKCVVAWFSEEHIAQEAMSGK